MIIASRQLLAGTDRDVDWGNGRSVRLLVAADEQGFTVTHTTVHAGSESRLCYERHCEACYCIDGEGEVELDGGERHELRPGVLYSPGEGEPHRLRARSTLHLVCVFTPALAGTERHSLSDTEASSY